LLPSLRDATAYLTHRPCRPPPVRPACACRSRRKGRSEMDVSELLEQGYELERRANHDLRRAVELYERALALDPEHDKVHYQRLAAMASLRDVADLIPGYEREAGAAPQDIRRWRRLALACLMAHEHVKAAYAIGAGLAVAPEDAPLVASRGELKAAT